MNDLFTPYKLKSLEVKNRIVMPPMCQYSVEKKMALPLTGIMSITSAVPSGVPA